MSIVFSVENAKECTQAAAEFAFGRVDSSRERSIRLLLAGAIMVHEVGI